jgi:hypothetical protein
MKCEKCRMFEARLVSHIEGSKVKYCMECYKRIVSRRIFAATQKEATFDRCMQCGKAHAVCKECKRPMLSMRLAYGYNKEYVPGIYCGECMTQEAKVEPLI